jgi:hypothetical protein
MVPKGQLSDSPKSIDAKLQSITFFGFHLNSLSFLDGSFFVRSFLIIN